MVPILLNYWIKVELSLLANKSEITEDVNGYFQTPAPCPIVSAFLWER